MSNLNSKPANEFDFGFEENRRRSTMGNQEEEGRTYYRERESWGNSSQQDRNSDSWRRTYVSNEAPTVNEQFEYAPSQQEGQVTTVANIGLADALLATKPSPWTKTMMKLYFFLLVAFLNSCINGYDGSLMSGINVMPFYQRYFHMKDKGLETGLVFCIYTIGNIVGSFFAGPFTDWWGRRWGMFIGASVIILGTCVQAPATSKAMFIGGRFVLGFGVAVTSTAGPSYVAEMAHPAWRGTLTGLYNTFWFVGGIPATWTLYGTQQLQNDLSWRLPIWLQAVASGLVVLGALFCPETPRWLISNDRHEEAIQVLTKYHGNGDRNSAIVLLEYREMMEEIYTEGSDKRWWDYSELVGSKPALWRMACVLGMAMFSQLSGNGPVSYFMPILLQNLGITDVKTQLMYNAVLNVLSFFVATIGARFTDGLGRRPVLLIGTSLFVFIWTMITVLTGLYGAEGDSNAAGGRAAIAFIYIFGITYSFAYTPLQALYPVECLSYETRAKGMAIYNLAVNIAGVINTFVIPVAFASIGWKLYFLYIAWDFFEVICIYFIFVETKDRTLEEISEIFDAPYPKQKSLQKHIIVITDRGILDKGYEQ
ncbi:hypothetical protein ABW21_db0206221 [Orbilia brochopaga]|nr:hypothetical protein ABW21_db0206221 [Drechslerella brochopaga]